jgi:hypothetical protein
MAKKSELDVLKRYVAEIDRFAELLRRSQEQIGELERDLAVKRQAHEEAKAAVKEAKDIEHSTITLLLKMVTPGSPEIMPLFDTMEPSVEKKHGPKSKTWRKEPIAVLGLSAAALRALIGADVVLVGQLQDLILADPEEDGEDEWWSGLEGVSAGMAEAILAKFYEYVEAQK